MSKKKKKRYWNHAVSGQGQGQGLANAVSTSPVLSVASSSPVSSSDKFSAVYKAHEEEYKNVKTDLVKVAIINGIFFLAVLVLYYINLKNPFLEHWYAGLF